MTYLNLKTNGVTETVDQFETRKEAKQMVSEYRLASSYYSGIYLSSRCTNDWKNK